MKANEVRLLPALDPGESYVEPKFLLVETAMAKSGDTVTTIDQVSSKVVDGSDTWTFVTLGQGVPLTHSAACEWAVSYAASRGIPLVYQRDSSGGADQAATQSAVAGAARVSSASK